MTCANINIQIHHGGALCLDSLYMGTPNDTPTILNENINL